MRWAAIMTAVAAMMFAGCGGKPPAGQKATGGTSSSSSAPAAGFPATRAQNETWHLEFKPATSEAPAPTLLARKAASVQAATWGFISSEPNQSLAGTWIDGMSVDWTQARLYLRPDGKARYDYSGLGDRGDANLGPQRVQLRMSGTWRQTGDGTAEITWEKGFDDPPLLTGVLASFDSRDHVVGGLQMIMTFAEGPVWDSWDDVALSLVLRNTTKERKVVAIRTCKGLPWSTSLGLKVETADLKTFAFLVDERPDLRYLHDHGPLELPPYGSLSYRVSFKDLVPVSHDANQSLGAVVAVSKAVRVWAEFPSDAPDQGRSSGDDPNRPAEPWRRYFSEGAAATRPAGAQEFAGGWPPWAWKGKLLSNVVTIRMK